MRTIYLIMRGKFSEEGKPYAVAKTKRKAIEYIKTAGYVNIRGCLSIYKTPLYGTVIDGCSYWTRIDPIQEVTCAH